MSDEDPSLNEETSARVQEQWTDHLRQLWQEARNANVPGVSVEEVLDRLERKYQPMVEAIERDQGTMAADVIRTRLGQMKSVSLTAQSVRNRGSE